MANTENTDAKGKIDFKKIYKNKILRRVLLLAVCLVLIPKVLIFFAICGLIDIMRNTRHSAYMWKLYFLGSGTITWMLAPFNLLIDLLCLPNWNKGIFKLEDLPEGHQAEITKLIGQLTTTDIVGKLERNLSGNDREMIFFKWYGHNIETPLDIPEFHEDYKFIRTIGISVFNKRKSTSRHFGPLRMTYRVLYNINTIDSDQIYIDVGKTRHFWHKEKLFIFDDTLLHQSINESDDLRYCAFVDILRPSPFSGLLSKLVYWFGAIFDKLSHKFYRSWSIIKS